MSGISIGNNKRSKSESTLVSHSRCTACNPFDRFYCKVCNTSEIIQTINNSEEKSNSDQTFINRNKFCAEYKIEIIESEQRRHEIEIKIRVKRIDLFRLTKTKFIDSSFPPTRTLLELIPNYIIDVKIYQWLSPNDIENNSNNSEWKLIGNPNISGVSQGRLGNCWFVSALALLANRPELLNKVMLTRDVNREGVYRVRLCLDGEWTTVLIDDKLPCDSDRKLIYANPKQNQLWAPFIEKAMAKLHGSYQALIGGYSIEPLSTLTGKYRYQLLYNLYRRF